MSCSSLFSVLYINCWIDFKNHEPVFIPRELLASKRYAHWSYDALAATILDAKIIQSFLSDEVYCLSVTEFGLASNKPAYNMSMRYNLQ